MTTPDPLDVARRRARAADAATPIVGSNATIVDFWQWAYSDLVSNDVRGALGEYLVALALGVTEHLPISWAAFDLAYEGFKIEVKTSGLWQAWGTRTQESALSWGIRPTRGWDPDTGAQPDDPVRPADLYVLARWTGSSNTPTAPLATGDWDFTVVPTSVLDSEFGGRARLSDGQRRRLINDGLAALTDFTGLATTVRAALGLP